jgi:hypothetical protein
MVSSVGASSVSSWKSFVSVSVANWADDGEIAAGTGKIVDQTIGAWLHR